jgi:hypothetical protein
MVKPGTHKSRKSRDASLWASQNKHIILFLLALIIFVAAIFCACCNLMLGNKQEAIQIDYAPTLDPIPDRMLVILLDGLRKDFAFSSYMPFISSCCERGAWGISKVVSAPLSIAGDHAIFSATTENLLSVFDDFTGSTSTYNNLFERITEQNKRAVILSSHCLRGAYGEYTDLGAFEPRHFLFSQYREDAYYLFQQAHRFLKEEKWDLAVVQFITLDYIGHLETPLSSDYLPTLLLIDDYVRQLVNLTTEQDVVLITSEHGMDDHGFHMDRHETVIETPFILFGPHIKKEGHREILQIDWAPTLSVLAGVSPFYTASALPALDLITLPAKDHAFLLKKFAEVIAETPGSLTLSELHTIRMHKMTKEGSPLIGILVIVSTVLSMILFAFVVLFHCSHGWNKYSRAITAGGGILALCSLIGILFHVGILDYLFYHLPFSANFILTHPLEVALAFALMVVIPMLAVRTFKKNNANVQEVLLLFLFVFVGAEAFLSTNSYHFLNWVVVGVPVVAWGVTRRTGWIIVCGAVWAGFAIRRLTFYNAYTPVHLPDRWLLVTFILVIGVAFLWWRLKTDPSRMRAIEFSILCFFPGMVIVAWPFFTVEERALFLLLGIIPVAVLSARKPKTRDVLWALWVSFFLLGTSSTINHATHIVALPLFIAMWSITKEAPVVVKGLIIGLLVWILYLLPGNALNLKLLEMSDRFILGTAMTKHIESTVAVIASRYILPPAVLIWVMKRMDSSTSLSAMASTAFLPVVCSMDIIVTLLVLTPGKGIPWEQTVRLTLLFGYFVVLIIAFLIVASAMQVGKLLHYPISKGKLSG